MSELDKAGDEAWAAFIAAAKAYAAHLDQWEKVKFFTEYGMVYVTISRAELHPDSFETVTPP